MKLCNVRTRDLVKLTLANARSEAEHSGEVVAKAVTAMQLIEASSQQISQIIGVIDEIAFQTNLLALNAGVEAARAGDAGRGFAVVASEVRALAQRSAEAAKEIKALISASTDQVAAGAKLVNETGDALGRIIARVNEVSAVVATIAQGAETQATGLRQINVAIGEMDQGTQQNAAMVEQSTAAAHSLSREAESMAELMAKFDIGHAGDASIRGELRKTVPHVFGSARRPAPPKSAHAKPQLAVAKPERVARSNGSGLVRQPAVVNGDEEGWTEF